MRFADTKTGDEVAIKGRSNDDYRIVVVSRTTKTLLVTDCNNTRWRRDDGEQFGSGQDRWFTGPRIIPVTNEIRLKVKRASLMQRVTHVPWFNCSDEDLETILKIAEKDTKGTK